MRPYSKNNAIQYISLKKYRKLLLGMSSHIMFATYKHL